MSSDDANSLRERLVAKQGTHDVSPTRLRVARTSPNRAQPRNPQSSLRNASPEKGNNPILLAKAQPARISEGPVRHITTRFAPSQKNAASIPAVTKKPGAAQKSAATEAQDYGYMELIQSLKSHPNTKDFLYLQRFNRNPSEYNPYALRVEAFAKIDPNDFYTLSVNGITYYRNKVSEGFTELAQWEREMMLFKQLKKLPLWRFFRVWKAFRLWSKSVRGAKLARCKAALSSSLFILNPVFQSALLKFSDLCCTVEGQLLLQPVPPAPVSLQDFLESQEEHVEKCKDELAEMADEALECVTDACKQSLAQLEKELAEFNKKQDKPQEERAMNRKLKDSDSNAHHDFAYTMFAATRSIRRSLIKFIRMTDYMLGSALRSVLISSCKAVVDTLVTRNCSPALTEAGEAAEGSSSNPAVPMFELHVSLSDDCSSLLLSPGETDFVNGVDVVLEGFVETCHVVERMLENEDLVCGVVEEEGLEVQTAMKDLILDEEYEDLKTVAMQLLSTAYQNVVVFVGTYHPFREMVVRANALDIQQMEQVYHAMELPRPADFVADGIHAVTLDTFASTMHRLDEEMQQMQAFRDEEDVAVMRLDVTAMKGSMLPVPKERLQAIKVMLPKLAFDVFTEFIGDVRNSASVLTTPDIDVTKFVEKMAFLKSLKGKEVKLDAQLQEVKQLYELIESAGIPVADFEAAELATLDSDFDSLKNAIEEVEGAREESTTTFVAGLERDWEELEKSVIEIRNAAQHEKILDKEADHDDVVSYLTNLKGKIDVLVAEEERINSLRTEFSETPVASEEMAATAEEVELKLAMWQASADFALTCSTWSSAALADLELKALEDEVQTYHKLCTKVERNLPPNSKVPELRDLVDHQRNLLPIVTALSNKSMRERHWKKMEEAMEVPLPPLSDASLTMEFLTSLKIIQYKDTVLTTSTEATQEAALEEMLSKVNSKWSDIEFQCIPYKDSKDMVILSAVDEITAALEDSMVTMSTIVSSRFVGGIRSEVEKLEKTLLLFSENLDEWLAVQQSWMYLESIFGAPDIQRQLPGPAKAFQAIDKEFRSIMRSVKQKPLALAVCWQAGMMSMVGNQQVVPVTTAVGAMQAGTNPGYLSIFQKANQSLEQIQKDLSDYLSMKRAAFARFYFLGDDELLEILAQSKNPQAVQPHMSKCFDGIKMLEFGDDPSKSTSITAMISAEGEKVPLGGNLKARGGVEVWLASVELEMQRSLARAAKEGLKSYGLKERAEWILEQPAQLVIVVSQIYWVLDVVKALQAKGTAMHEYYQVCLKQLSNLTKLVRGNLSKLHRCVVSALITIDVHARDIVNDFAIQGVQDENDFNWQMQLRYVWEANAGELYINQVNAQFQYAYEYLGAQARLVVTPMTDRCYMTLTGALHLKLGGAPAGPAGTGKTETTKDLGKALGVNCVVFNCGDNLDYKFMGKFFSGVAQSGAWACFDEFNRIDIEVLSVVAQQFLSIVNALKAGVKRFMFEGREIRLINTCGVFITMNPGYAGRTELPDNLKALFRPMAMMIPDYALVAEVMLFSEGFEDSRNLSRKMVKLYKLSSEQLSQQDHYDFGMRALKSLLVMAGSLKRAQPDVQEDDVLVQAMRDANLPKFLSDDAELFQNIISDLFPNVDAQKADNEQLMDAIVKSLHREKLQSPETFTRKVMQLYETLNVRFGVMTVGTTGGGKTTMLRTLQQALTMMRSEFKVKDPDFQVTHVHTFNPKCIRMGELYGEYNLLTNEWTDGLASTLIRTATADPTPDRKYICFDGPVDAIWIENMNTVLDDNCTLCLPNGERIKLNPQTMRMLFEVQDLAVASPATVSRCGMVYVPIEELGWRPFIETWLVTSLDEVSKPTKDLVWGLFDSLVDPVLKWIRANGYEYFKSVDVNLVTSLARILESMLKAHSDVILKSDQGPELIKLAVNKVFTYALIWGLGGNLVHTKHEEFDTFLRGVIGNMCQIPSMGNVFDIFVDVSSDPVELRCWSDYVPSFAYDKTVSFHSMFVPTADTCRFSHVMGTCLNVDRSVMFTGETGVGKTVIARSALESLSSKKNYIPYTVNFSAQTGAKDTQLLIESKLVKKRKTRFGAPPGSQLVFFIDDMNMPAREVYGAQPPVELLRQFQDFKGFYDREKLFWKEIENVTLCAACGPPGGGRQEVTPRMIRHFTLLSVPPPSDASTKTIFSTILQGFLGDFSADVQQLCNPLVSASLQVYQQVAQELLPTPTKSHYTFNLRDLAKVFQGMLMIMPVNCKESETFLRLWAHESMRVFHDRLVGKDDKELFKNMLITILNQNQPGNTSYEELFDDKLLLFGDFLKMGLDMDERRYEEIPGMEKLVQVLEEYLADYNATSSSSMNVVFFRDAVEHIVRMCRILRQPRGNALLIGVGGCGKSSMAKFSAHIGGFKCFSIEPGRNYGLTEFREDLKGLYTKAGVEGQNMVFLFSDNHIVCESFLEDINNMLNSGDVPGMFAQDEKDRIAADLRDWAFEHGYPASKEGCYTAFIDRVREKLHIVLAMSPVGDKFRNRCRQFPALINCCTIDLYTQWPEEALLSVSTQLLSNVNLGSDEVKSAVSEVCMDMHMSVSHAADDFYNELRRKYYTTPKSFLDLIHLYCSLLAERRMEMGESKERLLVGLQKLNQTNSIVDKMKAELGELQPILEEKSKATAELLVTVAKDKEQAAIVQAVVEKDAGEVLTFQKEVQVIADDAKADLAEALPVLESAVKSLSALNKGDIVEMKSFSKPPPLVMLTMEAVCTLRQEKPDWDTAKKMLGDSNFMEALKTFDKENIPDGVIKKLKKYIDNVEFVPETVAKQSNAAKSLCIWVHAMDKFHIVNKVVEPKKQKLAKAESELAQANAQLKEKQDALQAVLDKVAALESQLSQAQQEQKDLNDQAELTKARLVRAEKLTSALGDEGVRWSQSAEEISTAIELLIGDVLVSAATISYQGAFTAPYRQQLNTKWIARCKEKEIPIGETTTLRNTLGSPVEIREWNILGLPTDDLSVDNGIIVKSGSRWPLMIDPQCQASLWVKNMEAKNGLRVIKQTDNNFLRMLESSIRVGNPVLLEDIGESLDPSLEPLLSKAISNVGGRSVLRLGDTDVDFDPKFKFYITTKLTNPHYLPDVCIKVTVINFTVTMQGLEDQLLGDVVRMERPDLEEQKDNLVLSISADKKQLTELESKILRMLKESKGNILDDSDLINTLNNSKVTSGMIQGRVKEAETTEKMINDTRETYRPAAIRGSTLYFVMADLAMMSPMYQYSLVFFSKLFNYSIENAEKCEDVPTRVENICAFANTFIYTTVQRGLFANHKLIFSFLLATAILRHPSAGKIMPREWNYFLRGDAGVQDVGSPPATWLTADAWNNICFLDAKIPCLQGLKESIEKDAGWYKWQASEAPEQEAYPGEWDSTLTGFERLIILKVLRQEKLCAGMARYVGELHGRNFQFPPAWRLEEIFPDTNCRTPIVFVLSTGADPTALLQRFAESMGMMPGEKLHMISLGQGQGPIAENMIEQARKSGDWVCLQNCHVASSWMLKLESIVEDLAKPSSVVHEDFRLWLTSMPAKNFPIQVLQNSMKLTNEPPYGVRANVGSTYTNMTEDEFEAVKEKKAAWKKLAFSLAFFHAVIQERRKFGPNGWNIRYEFNQSDIECSMSTIQMFLVEKEQIPWDAIEFVVGQINYGGRVTDDNDRRCLMAILRKYIQPHVLKESYLFTPSGLYYSPAGFDTTLTEVREYLEALPSADAPEVFGMHANASIQSQLQETTAVLNLVVAMQPRIAGSKSGESPEEAICKLADKLLAEIPPVMDKHGEAHASIFSRGETGRLNSLSVVLSQEIDRFNRLTKQMQSSLKELQKAIKGIVVMSDELEQMLHSMLDSKVPQIWAKVAYPCLKPLGSWFKDYLRRVAFLRKWLTEGQPSCFWLPGFFFPQGFLTGVLQVHARKYTIPIDTLAFQFAVTDMTDSPEVEEPPEDGIYINGLFVDGARWAQGSDYNDCLTDAEPGCMYSPVPVVHFKPSRDQKAAASHYSCPLYKTSLRAGILSTTGQSTNFVLYVDLPMAKGTTQDYWILQGVSLLCMLDT